jgi:hypothetical protein
MGDLQEWLFGFRINDYEVAPFQKDGQDEVDVRYLKDLEVFEVSPVLVGANRETYTLAIKSGEEAVYESNNLEEEKAALARDMFDNPGEAMNRSKELSCAVGVHTETMDGKEVFMPCKTHAEYEEAIKDEKKDLDSVENTDEVLEENQEKVSEEESLPTGKRFSEEVKDVLAALESLIVRAKAIEVLRSKDGRTLSERASSALRAVQEDLNDAWTEIDDILGDATSEVEGATEETVEDNPVEETQGSTVTETEEAVEPEIDEDAEIEESEVEVEDVIEVEEEEAETEEVVLEEVDEEIEALFAESQGLIADSILVELDDEEV